MNKNSLDNLTHARSPEEILKGKAFQLSGIATVY